jgi:hypothetical protein
VSDDPAWAYQDPDLPEQLSRLKSRSVVRVLLLYKHTLLRDIVVRLLEEEEGIELLDTCLVEDWSKDPPEQLLKSLQPDVVLMDHAIARLPENFGDTSLGDGHGGAQRQDVSRIVVVSVVNPTAIIYHKQLVHNFTLNDLLAASTKFDDLG